MVGTWSQALNSKTSSVGRRYREPNWKGSLRLRLLAGSWERCGGVGGGEPGDEDEIWWGRADCGVMERVERSGGGGFSAAVMAASSIDSVAIVL